MPKPQLHASQLVTLSRCGEQFRRRYIDGDVVPPGVAAAVGKAVHSSVEENMRSKLERRELLAKEAVEAAARDALLVAWDEGVRLDEEEREAGEAATKGAATDRAVRLAGLHHEELAPRIAPVRVEWKWVIRLDNFPMDLAGRIDIQEEDSIRDTKTSSKTPAKDAADTSLQLTVYTLARRVLDGIIPGRLFLDHLVALKRAPKIETQETARSEADLEAALRRVEVAMRLIEAGLFQPADPSQWWCGWGNPRWCGYAQTCPYVRGRKTFQVPRESHLKNTMW